MRLESIVSLPAFTAASLVGATRRSARSLRTRISVPAHQRERTARVPIEGVLPMAILTRDKLASYGVELLVANRSLKNVFIEAADTHLDMWRNHQGVCRKLEGIRSSLSAMNRR